MSALAVRELAKSVGTAAVLCVRRGVPGSAMAAAGAVGIVAGIVQVRAWLPVVIAVLLALGALAAVLAPALVAVSVVLMAAALIVVIIVLPVEVDVQASALPHVHLTVRVLILSRAEA